MYGIALYHGELIQSEDLIFSSFWTVTLDNYMPFISAICLIVWKVLMRVGIIFPFALYLTCIQINMKANIVKQHNVSMLICICAKYVFVNILLVVPPQRLCQILLLKLYCYFTSLAWIKNMMSTLEQVFAYKIPLRSVHVNQFYSCKSINMQCCIRYTIHLWNSNEV